MICLMHPSSEYENTAYTHQLCIHLMSGLVSALELDSRLHGLLFCRMLYAICIYHACSMLMIHAGRILLQHDISFQLLPLEPITDPPTFTLTCVTTGGPPTNVTWRRDNTEIDYQNNSNFAFSRTVTNFTTSTYNNTLTVTGRYPGRYNMTAWNRNTVLYIGSQPATSALLVKGM